MELKDLVGEHLLDAVDFSEENLKETWAMAIRIAK